MKRSEIRIPLSMLNDPEHILDRYRDLIMKGESPGMASILASRQAPGLETATNHFVGQRPLAEVAGADYAALVYNQAKKAGIPVNEHSRYNGTIADHRRGGDPDAWIHNGESHDKFRQVCEKRGKPCDSLRTNVDLSRLSEMEAKREQGINKRKAAREAKAEAIADKKQKLGVPV